MTRAGEVVHVGKLYGTQAEQTYKTVVDGTPMLTGIDLCSDVEH